MDNFKYVEVPMGFYVPEERLKFGVDITWPIHLEPQVPTMNKKLVINVAPTGALISQAQNPTQPYTPEEIAKEAIAAYKEGASMFHIHCRRDGEHAVDAEIYKETLDLVFAEAPDMITNLCVISASNTEGPEKRMKPIVEPLLKYGKKYARIAIVNVQSFSMGQTPPFVATPVGIMEETAYLESVGVKPFLASPEIKGVDVIKECLIGTGIAKKPYYMALGCGVHGTVPTIPTEDGFINMMQVVKRFPKEDVVWESCPGGRNWLPMAVFSIMLGCDIIRVGKEDAIYKYPHKDDMITSCADVVNTIATIAKSLGREIATPAEAKEILGLQD